MCGIIGFVTKNSQRLEKELDLSISSLSNRGPDGHGKLFFENSALGHSRLSIVDIDGGKQPMVGQQQTAITFNGEIYGYKKIKDNLPSYNFKTSSDTEVVLALYETYGEDMLHKLPGMFAFAIWDERKQTLFAARDRFGEKPFYYTLTDDGTLIFASEIKAIIATNLIKPILSKKALTHYLQHLYVEPNKTIYENIFVLPPAHYLSFSNGSIRIKKYWNIPPINKDISMVEATKTFSSLLHDAVRDQLIADVPVGSFLSGGLDSTTIVYLAKEIDPDIRTFSFGFGKSINELPFAKEVALRYGTKHTELGSVDQNIADLTVKTQQMLDEPFADSSIIPTFLISKEAKKHVKVVLTGDGADELCGGYRSSYLPISIMSGSFFYGLIILLKNIMNIKDAYYILVGLWAKLTKKDPLNFHVSRNSYFSDKEIEQILHIKNNFKLQKPKSQTTIENVFTYDVSNYMAGDILVKIDRAPMACGLELRSPFLNVPLAEFCLSLPARFKINSSKDKVILRSAFEKYWPQSVQKRRKQGFGAPIREWLHLPEMEKLKNDYLENRNLKIYKIINFDYSRDYCHEYSYRTWILLCLSIWMEHHQYTLA